MATWRCFSRFDTIPVCHRRTDGRTDGRTDRQTDRQTDTPHLATGIARCKNGTVSFTFAVNFGVRQGSVRAPFFVCHALSPRPQMHGVYAMAMSFCFSVYLSVYLFVHSFLFVCRLWNVLSHSLRGSTWRRAGAYRIVSDTPVWFISVVDSQVVCWNDILLIAPSDLQRLFWTWASLFRYVYQRQEILLDSYSRSDLKKSVGPIIATANDYNLPWVGEIRYLGTYNITGRQFRCSVTTVKRSLHRSIVVIFWLAFKVSSIH